MVLNLIGFWHNRGFTNDVSFVFENAVNTEDTTINNPVLFSEIASSFGPWSKPKTSLKPGRDLMQISISNKGKSSIRDVKKVKNNVVGKGLAGKRRERSTTMYLSNIDFYDQCEEGVIEAVKNHAHELGIRVMSATCCWMSYKDPGRVCGYSA